MLKLSLKQQVTAKFGKYKGQKIPWIVKLIENPVSPLALPGKISLYNHDCLHILFDRDLSLESEAFIIGFCMGNDSKTQKIHVNIFKFFSQFLYPKDYQIKSKHLVHFDAGFSYGRSLKQKLIDINRINFSQIEFYSVDVIRKYLGINLSDVYSIQQRYIRQEELDNTLNKSSFSTNPSKITLIFP